MSDLAITASPTKPYKSWLHAIIFRKPCHLQPSLRGYIKSDPLDKASAGATIYFHPERSALLFKINFRNVIDAFGFSLKVFPQISFIARGGKGRHSWKGPRSNLGLVIQKEKNMWGVGSALIKYWVASRLFSSTTNLPAARNDGGRWKVALILSKNLSWTAVRCAQDDNIAGIHASASLRHIGKVPTRGRNDGLGHIIQNLSWNSYA